MAEFLDLGRLGYLEAWDTQKGIQADVQSGNRDDTLIFVEHPPVMTLGASFHEENLRLPRSEYAELGIDLIKTDRGGDVTFHGPQQLVIYPVFDLRRHGKDLHRWLRNLEETFIQVCASFGLKGERSSVNTGVWIRERKVAAIGIKVSKWVSIHGIALNCNNDLCPFETIVPCGIQTHVVTSLSVEAGREITIEDAKPEVAKAFQNVFGITFQTFIPNEVP
ncbi:MAG: lipoyl(octanoyl) transferase LipB [Chlorobia bacterium]|nr:lipoyl(octanoyl) transferase LipB [Fimbriimonadaceae bacterium]